MATPSVPVVAVAEAEPPANAPLAPLAGALNVTVAPGTGLPEASAALAARFVAYAMPAVAVCPLPAVTVSELGSGGGGGGGGGRGGAVYVRSNETDVATPAPEAKT